MAKTLILGSRGSELALWQANFIKKELEKVGIKTKLNIIKTTGDKNQDIQFSAIQGQGFFTKEIEEALLKKEIDFAVHSYKDLPTTPVKGLTVTAVSYREDPAELILINKGCIDPKRKLSLKKNALVGTSSARRRVQLLAFRPDIEIKELRGNIPTRLQKLRDGMYEAIVVAAAAVERLGIDVSEFHSEKLTPQEFVPAPAQGVLGLQIREGDKVAAAALEKINHPEVEEIVSIERKIFNLFRGGCNLPLGIYCEKHTDEEDKPVYKAWSAYSNTDNAFPRYFCFETRKPEGWAEKVAEKIRAEKTLPLFLLPAM